VILSIPTSWLVFAGMFLGFTLAVSLFIPAIFWLGWASKRERKLERDLSDALQCIDELILGKQLTDTKGSSDETDA
jgi:hypothetical protein